ncbi:KIN17-like protein [Golovinomyces cichoracearum]|uniref:KIN17-like protein n=1 Tax=Golovinomyces cichoracearum TaxID=62708 RepID=A0A420IZM0_9PEZI|nr:KIN17-like protein [Golovinomyces cichoracearum]
MPKAEVGSTKYLNNKLKSKGLQRLRWYCQVCERQMRDENGFKMHTQSESHFRQMLLVGEDPKKFINDYSNQFHRDFLQLLRTSHGEKMVHMNHFYQEYIHKKEHIHMNATKWLSLTEYAKYLGREGICRVEENEKGLHISWIDNSPEKLRRQDAIRKKERLDKGDEEREQMLIREQIKRARMEAMKKSEEELDETQLELKRAEGETVKLNFGMKLKDSKIRPSVLSVGSVKIQAGPQLPIDNRSDTVHKDTSNSKLDRKVETTSSSSQVQVSMKVVSSSKPKNVFTSKKNALVGKKVAKIEQPKKMSEVERIMREETEQRNKRGSLGFNEPGHKKQKISS